MISHEELLHRRVGELYDFLSIEVDNGDQARACRKHGCFGIGRAPTGVEFGDPSRFFINLDCENLREFHDAKRASRYCKELEDTMGKLPLLLVDALERAFVCFL